MHRAFPSLQSPLVNKDTWTVSTAWYRLFLRLAEEIPIGTVTLFAGASAPSQTLLCDGAAVSRTTYAELFDVIGITFGPGDGSTTFNLPNIADVVANVSYYIYY